MGCRFGTGEGGKKHMLTTKKLDYTTDWNHFIFEDFYTVIESMQISTEQRHLFTV